MTSEKKLTFETDLWNKLDLIIMTFKEKRKKVKNLINIISDKYSLDENYSNKLKKLFPSNSIKVNDQSMNNTINQISTYYSLSSTSLFNANEKIKQNVIVIIESLIKKQIANGEKLEKEYKNRENEYKSIQVDLEKIKNKYLNQGILTENLIKDYEMMKYSNNHNQVLLDKLKEKSDAALTLFKEYEITYINLIYKTNQIRSLYIEDKIRILNTFETLELYFSETVKEALGNYVFYIKSTNIDYSFYINELTEVVNSINSENDNRVFIKSNMEQSKIPEEHELIRYSLSLKSIQIYDHTLPYEVVLNTIKKITDYMILLKEDENWNYDDELMKGKVIQEIQKIIKDGNLNEDEEREIFLYMNEKKYRGLLLNCLNNLRNKGCFTITEATFDFIGKLFNYIIDNIEEYQDYESVNYIIILSQTFKYNEHSLQSKIEKNKILKEKSFWMEIINFKIREELKNDDLTQSNPTNRNYIKEVTDDNSVVSYLHKESPEEKIVKMQNIVFGQLLPSVYNMIDFNVDKQTIKDLCLLFSEKYKLNHEFIQLLESSISDNK